MTPELLRAWCRSIALVCPRRVIGERYLTRYYLAGWNAREQRPQSPGLYLHHFIGSDPRGSVHSHPWEWSISFVLVGGYREERCNADGSIRVVKTLGPGDMNVIRADDRHRIELLDAECWTLFVAGPFVQDWTSFPEC